MASFSSTNSLVNVGIALTLQDHFSSPAGQVLASWDNLMRNISTFQRGLASAYENSINNIWGLLKGMGNMASYATEIEKNTFLTSKTIDGTLDHQENLLNLAKDINLRNPLTLLDITSGQRFMAMAGMTAEQIKEASEPASQLAAVFNMDTGKKGGTADLLTNIMATFGMAAETAPAIANTLAVATTSANVSLEDLAQSIKYSGAAARNIGMDVEELTAFLGVFGNRGIQGSMAGTNFAQAINSLVKVITGQKSEGVLGSIGLSPRDLQDSQGNLLSMYEISQKIAAATKNLTSTRKQSVMFELFGQRGMRPMVAILEDINSGSNQYLKILQAINGQPNWLNETTEQYMKSAGWLNQFNSAVENLKVTVGGVFKDIIRPLSQHIVVPFFNTLSNFLKGDGFSFGKWAIGASLIIPAFRLLPLFLGYAAIHIKAMTTSLLTGTRSAGGLSANLGLTKANAAGLAVYLERCAMTLNRMAYMSSITGGARMASSYMALGGGYFYRVNKDGAGAYYQNVRVKNKNGGYTTTRRQVTATQAMGLSSPVIMGRGYVQPGTASSYKAGSVRGAIASPMYQIGRRFWGATGTSAYARMMTRGVLGMTRGISFIGSVLGRVAGFLMGPFGMAITLLLTFLPTIMGWLKPSTKEQQTKEESNAKSIEEALRKGQSTTVNVNINGTRTTSRVVGSGDTVNLNTEDYDLSGGYLMN